MEKSFHWIVYNPRTSSIWQRPYMTLEEATRGFAEVIRRDGDSAGWVIERKTHYTERGGRVKAGVEDSNEW